MERLIPIIILAVLCSLTSGASGQQIEPLARGEKGKKPPVLRLPPRPIGAVTGSQFALQIEKLSPAEREAAILTEIKGGNVPPFLLLLKPIEVEAMDDRGVKHSGTYFATPDYLAVGSDRDFFRLPMTPQTGQALADEAGATLITAKMSGDIWRQADLKLSPQPLTKDREKSVTLYQHHQLIEAQRGDKQLGLLVAGIKKDVVVTNRLKEREHRVAIFGWHYPDGKPIQSLYVGHIDSYVDYSHGIRLVSRQMLVDGVERDLNDVLTDDNLSVLISNEGPILAGYK